MKYVVNKLSVILLDSDKDRGLNTVAYNHQTDELMAIRPGEYAILKWAEENDGFTEVEIEGLGFDPDVIRELVKKEVLEIND